VQTAVKSGGHAAAAGLFVTVWPPAGSFAVFPVRFEFFECPIVMTAGIADKIEAQSTSAHIY